MITPNEKRTHLILDYLVTLNFDYVWVADIKTFQYELHCNENVTPLDMPESGNALALLDYIKKTFVNEDYQRDYRKLFSARRLLRQLRKKNEIEIDFPFSVGMSHVKIFWSDFDKNEILVCSKVFEVESTGEKADEKQAMLILELDQRKHFVIRNIDENISQIFNVPLLKFTKGYKHDAFAGYHPDDRIRTEKMFLDNAKDGSEFQTEVRINTAPNLYQMIHLNVKVKKYNRSYIYYVMARKVEQFNPAVPNIIEKEENPRKKVHSFDVDILTSTAHLGREMCKYYGIPSVIHNFPNSMIEQGLIHSDDFVKLQSVIDGIKQGSPYEEVSIRVKGVSDKDYVWRSLSLNNIVDDLGYPVRALGYSEDITFYKDQETRFHDVLEMCGFITWDYDIENVTFSNHGNLKKMFGFSDEDLSNIPESVIQTGAIHNEDIELIRNLHRSLRDGAKTVDCEFRGRNINGGNYNWYKLRYTIVNDKNGNLQYAVGSATDINEQKTAELSFEYEAKTLYELQGDTLVEKCCINATRDEVKSFFTKQQGEVSVKNRAYSDVLKSMMNFCVNEDTSRLFWNKLNPESLLKSFGQGNKSFSFVHRRQMRNNTLQWVSSKVNMYQDPKSGDVIGFIYTYDINRKKLSQEALELIGISDYDLVGIVDVVGGGAIILHDNDILSRVPNWDCGDYDAYFEQYADRMRDYLESEDDYINLHDKIKISSLIRELEKAPIFEVIINHHKRNVQGTCVFRTTFRYLDDEHYSILMCMSDITSALAEERERENVLKNALEQANTASHAKTDFLARMSHDIRTPLNGIMGMTQLAMEEDDPDLIHEYLEKIDTSSHFLLGLLNDILDMSRIEKGVINLESDNYSLGEFRSSLESIIMPLCRNKDIRLNVQIDGECSFITDKQKFNQIFFNLLSNSVKFTEVGGVIDVIADNMKVIDGKLSVDFIVRDYGCGMTEEFQTKMFEAFSQERNSMTSRSQGTGLGLAIVKSLVEKMGGVIDVWSSVKEEDHGTRSTVHFDLPLSE